MPARPRHDHRLTDHFNLSEFVCKCGKYCDGLPDPVKDAERSELVRSNLRLLAENIELGIRQPLCVPITIISGYRCAEHNRRVGGAPSSKHLDGSAADLKVLPKFDGGQVFNGAFLAGWIEAQQRYGRMRHGGVGTYHLRTRTVHYDIRGFEARWHHG